MNPRWAKEEFQWNTKDFFKICLAQAMAFGKLLHKTELHGAQLSVKVRQHTRYQEYQQRNRGDHNRTPLKGNLDFKWRFPVHTAQELYGHALGHVLTHGLNWQFSNNCLYREVFITCDRLNWQFSNNYTYRVVFITCAGQTVHAI